MTATRIVPEEDVTLVVGPGLLGEGTHQIKAGQYVPIEFEAAYLAQVGQEQVDDESVEIEPTHETVIGHGPTHSGEQTHSGRAANFDQLD